jgi:hypothetical protein
MVRRLGVLALLFTMMCGAAMAQGATQSIALDPTPPSRAQVLAFMTAMGIQQNVDTALKNAQDKVKAAARASYKKNHSDADAASLKKLDEVFDSTPLFGFTEISETIVSVYQKNLSASDVQAGIDFYSSEAGKRLVQKIPMILRQTNENSQQIVQQKLAAYGDEIARKLEAFQSQMEKEKPSPTAKPNDADSDSKTTEQKSK